MWLYLYVMFWDDSGIFSSFCSVWWMKIWAKYEIKPRFSTIYFVWLKVLNQKLWFEWWKCGQNCREYEIKPRNWTILTDNESFEPEVMVWRLEMWPELQRIWNKASKMNHLFCLIEGFEPEVMVWRLEMWSELQRIWNKASKMNHLFCLIEGFEPEVMVWRLEMWPELQRIWNKASKLDHFNREWELWTRSYGLNDVMRFILMF